MKTVNAIIPTPHNKQVAFIDHPAKRKIVRGGRRGGKTTALAILAAEKYLDGRRILYAVPTTDQLDRFWTVVTRIFAEPIEEGAYYKNESKHIIELKGTEQRIRAKTAWNADTLRGDYADYLILDEFQLMNEEAWGVVGAPMLLDNNGDAIFVYTPPSLRSRSTSKADDKMHAAKLWKSASLDKTGRWAAFHFTSLENPHISSVALKDIIKDMTSLAYRQEILAEDLDEAPGALWKRDKIDSTRLVKPPKDLDQVVVAVDPSATSTGDEAGIITQGRKQDHYFTLADDSLQGSPEAWAQAAITAYHKFKADCIVAEKNNGGEMVQSVIKQAIINARKKDKTVGNVPVRLVWASRGKATRAEPVSAISEQGRDHHIGTFSELEDELCMWTPGDASPNRLDAKVWGMTYLSENEPVEVTENPFYG